MAMKDAQTAWDMAESIDQANNHLKKWDDKRNELLEKHGTPVEDQPGQYTVKDPQPIETELKKLSQVDVKLTFPKLIIADLNGLPVTPVDVAGWKELKILTKK